MISNNFKHSVAILQRIAPHYRHAFFRGLRASLGDNNIDLNLYYGDEYPGSVPKSQYIEEPWAIHVQNRYYSFGGRDMVWQSTPGLSKYNLVIVEHAARLLNNYSLLAARRLGLLNKMAFWGHGENLQHGRSRPVTEFLKRILLHQVDHYFAYTSLSHNRLLVSGLDDRRITIVNNTIDSLELKKQIAGVSQDQMDAIRNQIGLQGEHVAIYCGGLYQEKRIEFLIESAIRIRREMADFELIVIGDGPDATIVDKSSKEHDWIKYIGPVFGDDLALYYRLSQCLLMPGMVGLAIIDAFTAELPLLTTNHDMHSPEIAYLEDGINGLITPATVNDYAAAVILCLTDINLLKRLRAGCRVSSDKLTMANMTHNFTKGILKCLNT